MYRHLKKFVNQKYHSQTIYRKGQKKGVCFRSFLLPVNIVFGGRFGKMCTSRQEHCSRSKGTFVSFRLDVKNRFWFSFWMMFYFQ